MKVITEMDLCDFEAWSGGKDTLEFLIEHMDDEVINRFIEEIFPDGIDEVSLNDFLWFDRDQIAKILGFETYDEYVKDREEDKE